MLMLSSTPPRPSHFNYPDNATRSCSANGTWNNYTNYDQCQHIMPLHDANAHDFKPAIEVSTYIYVSGYALSLAALVLALLVFINFK